MKSSKDTLPGAPQSVAKGLTGFNRKSLAREIFQGRVPDEFVRSLPAQSLYMAIKHNGLESSSDVLDIATIDQFRLFIDFECWTRDRFSEDSFWAWLRLLGESDELNLLQKFLASVDLKLIAIMMSKYVDVRTFEERTENPPGPHWYTPDSGYTWLFLKTDENYKHFLLGKLLALLFETNSQLFYQLLFVPNVSTESLLEEEAYQDRCRRLSSEGIPSRDMANKMNSAITEGELLLELKKGKDRPKVVNIPVVDPLIYEPRGVEPLSSLAESVSNKEEFECELTLIMNGAIVHWSVDFAEQGEVMILAGQVQGVINIGLESLLANSSSTMLEIFEEIGLQNLYRLGLKTILELKRQALKISEDELRKVSNEAEIFSIVANLRENFPRIPLFFNSDGTIVSEGGSLMPGSKPIEKLSEVISLRKFLDSHFPPIKK